MYARTRPEPAFATQKQTRKILLKNRPEKAVHKRRPHSGGRGLVQCGHFTDNEGGGSSEAESALFGVKNFEFFKIYGVSARTRGS